MAIFLLFIFFQRTFLRGANQISKRLAETGRFERDRRS